MYLAKDRGEKATIYANTSNQPYKQFDQCPVTRRCD